MNTEEAQKEKSKGKIGTLISYGKRGAFDELYTPEIAVEMLIPYIPKEYVIWECTAIKESQIVKVLRKHGFKVITSHINEDENFLNYEPKEHYDMIITNPPYSLKDAFLQRGFELGKPFMYLLPLTALEGDKRGKLYQKYGNIQLLIPNKRFNFIEEKKGSWFQTSWFCYKMNFQNDLNFVSL